MIYLLLSILASTVIFIIFKLINKYEINTLQVIVVNYITACLLGLSLSKVPFKISNILTEEWFYGAFFLGILFIIIFNVMALTAQRNGISVASVATKMSVIIPILFGIYVYHESHGPIKIIGILIALIAVYLASVKSEKLIVSIKSLWLPITVFFGSGIIDTSIKFMQNEYLSQDKFSLFSSVIFFFAGTIGIITLAFQFLTKKNKFNLKSIPAGILLGIVNFSSIYYLLLALSIENLESSTIFTINNVGIVLISTLVGLTLFKEKLYPKNWLGIALAVIAIFLVSITI
ncbi:EamA-like transporter family protein [Flavobacteriaceae bacterium MAR_2010_188]|nr:EamA-like transporter family protein [Flavobacteriaceae bacterium MAR_2010_188]